MKRLYIIGSIILMLSFTACQPIANQTALPPQATQTTAPDEALPTPSPTLEQNTGTEEESPQQDVEPTAESVTIDEAYADLPLPDNPTPLPGTPEDETLVIEVPTPGPVPVSAWRPALYPVPWALGQFDHFYFNRPVAADEINWPLPEYRYGAINFGPDVPHTGVDITVDEGTSIIAAAPGTVESAGYGIYRGTTDENDPYGLAVVLRHDFGYNGEPLFTIYAHLSEILVIPGQRVNTGDILGLSGETGFTTGPHLHFEVRVGEGTYWSTRNPELWLVPPQGWGVLVGRITDNRSQPLNSPQDYQADYSTGTRLRITNLDTNQRWWGNTYGTQVTIRPDNYYRENFVMSDLPAGNYEIMINYLGTVEYLNVKIVGGGVTYFRWNTVKGFDTILPSAPIPSTLPLSGQ